MVGFPTCAKNWIPDTFNQGLLVGGAMDVIAIDGAVGDDKYGDTWLGGRKEPGGGTTLAGSKEGNVEAEAAGAGMSGMRGNTSQ